MKYESWLKVDQQYKCNLIIKLTPKQYNNFISQFFINKEQTLNILFKKLNVLFGSNKLKLYTISELIKLNKIVSKNKLSLDVTIKLFEKFKTINITEHNAYKLFLKDIDKNFEPNIKWGKDSFRISTGYVYVFRPGNHKNITDNICAHFKKHVLSDESKYWKKILDNISCRSYIKYAIDSFYKMKNKIIHTNGFDVYLSGFHGNVFIIGRYNDDKFGISSCYYVKSGKKLGRYEGLCLQL